MIPLLIGLAVAAGLLLLVLLYWSMLESLFPEKLSSTEVVHITTGDLWKIRMCRYRRGRTGGQPVLLIHGANSNQYNFTVPEGLSLVDFLVERGYDCWTIDLRGCRSSVAPFERDRSQITTDDFLNDDIPTAIRYVQEQTGYARLHLVGHSLGGMLIYAYALKFGTSSIASAVTLGAPLGFEGISRQRPPILFKIVGMHPPLSGAIVRGLVPLFSALRLSTRVFPTNMRNVARTMNSGHFFRMIEDPLPGVLEDFSRWINYPGWRMDKGNLNVLEGLSSLDFPLFALYAPLDPFVPISKATEFFEALPSADKRLLICSKEKGFRSDYNHCDLAFSHDGAREIFGPMARWFETHSSRERIPVVESEIPTGYQSPLAASERAKILSGGSYAHLSDEDTPVSEPVTADGTPTKQPPAKKKAATRKKAAAKKKATPTDKKPTPSKKKATATKKKAAPKKPAAKKKAAAKAKTAPPREAEKTPATEATATTAGSATRKAPARGKDGGPNLAAASAALGVLGPAPKQAGDAKAPAIRVKPRTAPKATTTPDGTIETPGSVLKALSDASSVLDSLKDNRRKPS